MPMQGPSIYRSSLGHLCLKSGIDLCFPWDFYPPQVSFWTFCSWLWLQLATVVFCRGWFSAGHVQTCRNWFNLLLRILIAPQAPLALGKGGGQVREEETGYSQRELWSLEIPGEGTLLRKEKVPQASLNSHQTISSQVLEQTPAPLFFSSR